jgi:hypothetical protein
MISEKNKKGFGSYQFSSINRVACAACDAKESPTAPVKRAIKVAINLFIIIKEPMKLFKPSGQKF